LKQIHRAKCQQGSKQFNNPDIRERLWLLQRKNQNKVKVEAKKSKLKLKMTEKKANKGLDWQN